MIRRAPAVSTAPCSAAPVLADAVHALTGLTTRLTDLVGPRVAVLAAHAVAHLIHDAALTLGALIVPEARVASSTAASDPIKVAARSALAMRIVRTAPFRPLGLLRLERRALIRFTDLASRAVQIVDAACAHIGGADPAAVARRLTLEAAAAVGARPTVLEASARAVVVDAAGPFFTGLVLTRLTEPGEASVQAHPDRVDTRPRHLRTLLVRTAVPVACAGSGTGPPSPGRRTFETLGAGVVAVARLAFLRVAAVNAQREPLIILTVERSAGGPLWTGRVAALTGLIAARIVLITKAQEALLARAADTGLTSARCVGEGVGAQTDVLTTALPTLVTRRTVAAGLAAILAVAIRDAEP